MNTFQLSCFLAVANSLSFARAAKQMNISQPAVTNQIKTLEKELGTKLFRRSTRMVELTPEGQAFIGDAKAVIAITDQAKLRYSNPDENAIEVLSIGCSNHSHWVPLSDILNELAITFPNLHPQLHIVPQDQLFHLLEMDSADVILDMREGNNEKERYTFKELSRSDLVCVCRKSHPIASRERISRSELDREQLIFCNPINLAPDIAALQWNLMEGRRPSDAHFCDSIEAAIVLAAAGLGVAILPELLVPDIERIVKVKTVDSPKFSFGLFYKPYPDQDTLKKFIQIAKKHFAGEPENSGKPV